MGASVIFLPIAGSCIGQAKALYDFNNKPV